jgi:serine phosphatase RsbU (regulator of sigma subunit)
MKLRTQLLLGIGILVVVLLTMAALVVSTRMQVAGLRSQHEIANSVQQEANDLASLSSSYLLYGDQVLKDRRDSLYTSFLRDVNRLEPASIDDSALVNSIKTNSRLLQLVFADVASTAADSAGGSPAEALSFLQVSLSRMEVQNRQIVFAASRLEQSLEDQVDHANLVSNIVVFTMMALFGVLLLAWYVTMYRRVFAGLAAIRAGTLAVGQGDLDYLIPAERRDELGDLSRAFNTMTTDLKQVTASKTELEREIAERKQAEAERERLLDELSSRNAELARREEELEAQNEALREAEEATARLLAERSAVLVQLQNALVHIPQELPGVKFGHLYRSATKEAQVGGDFYDVFETRYGEIGLLIGDVSGHGTEAARIATLVKDTVHAFAHQFRRPHRVLRVTNRLLVEKDLPVYVTAFLGFLEPSSGMLRYCSAGHPPPLLVSDGNQSLLETNNLPLGAFPDAHYRDGEALIHPASLLLFYTDGITDARLGAEVFGEEGLRRSLSRISPLDVEAIPGMLLADALRFSGEQLQDDVALLAVSYLGVPRTGS